MIQTMWQDARYGMRMLWKTPGFTVVAVLTLALGIGANTAIFAVVNAVMVRPLPVPEPQRLVTMGDPSLTDGASIGTPQTRLLSYPLYRELERRNEVFQDMYGAATVLRSNVAVGDENGGGGRVRLVTGGYFKTLGIGAVLGRIFNEPAEAAHGANPVAVVSYSFWQRRLGGDPNVVGRTIRVNNFPLTVIGVAAPEFTGDVVGEPVDLWAPMSMQTQLMPGYAWLNDPHVSWMLAMGRLKDGVTLAQARDRENAALHNIANSTFGAQFEKDDRGALQRSQLEVTSGARGFSAVRDQFSKPLLILLAIVGFVLLIACVNVANLLLARSAARRKEIAVRLAIGASPWRLVQQLLTESVLLSFVGGLCGVLMAPWTTLLVVRLVMGGGGIMPLDTGLDGRVLGFTAAVCVLAGVLFGLVPALRTRKVNLTSALQEGGRDAGAAGGHGRWSAGRLLVAGQVALSVIVLFAAGLLVQSLRNLQNASTGFMREGIYVARLDLAAGGYKEAAVMPVLEQLSARIGQLPAVQQVTYSENGLFSGTECSNAIEVEGYKPPNSQSQDQISYCDTVGPGYFKMIGLPMVRGRDIEPQDAAKAAQVAVVNQAWVKFYLHGADPTGHILTVTDEVNPRHYTIVGVAADARDHDVRQSERRYYVPVAQSWVMPTVINFEVRVDGREGGTFADTLRAALRESYPNLPVLSIKTVDELERTSFSDNLAVAQLSGLFAGLALLLACIGLYGVTAYAVAGRTREIGVRMALGAKRADVLWMVLREALTMVILGIAVGIPAAIAASQMLGALLFGVRTVDPGAIGATALILTSVAVIAALEPARRATRVDPMVALRYE